MRPGGLRFRTLFPLVILGVGLIAYLYGYWMPSSLANIEAAMERSIERHLDSVCEGLVPLLLARQLDAVYENMDSLMAQNRDWVSLMIMDGRGKNIYPLKPVSPEAKKRPESSMRTVDRKIKYLDMNLGRLVLDVDFAPRLSDIRRRHLELMSVMLVVISAFILTVGFVADRKVIRPVKLLSHASRKLAEGNFDAPLFRTGDDEIGNLVDDFDKMRNSIREYRTSLQKTHDILLVELEERKKAEAELDEAHKRLLTVLNCLDAIVYVADMRTYEMLFINKYLEDIFGDIRGKPCWMGMQAGQTGPCDFCTNKYLLDDGGEPSGVYRWEMKNTLDGRWYDVRDRAVRWIDGRTVRMEIATDITERKKSEEEISKLNEDLDDRVNRRTAELENMNMELKKMNRLFVGRELKMVELKKTIEDLECRLRDLEKKRDT